LIRKRWNYALCWRTAALIALGLTCGHSALFAMTAEPASPGQCDIALTYFVSSYGDDDLPISVQELRHSGDDALTLALESKGMSVCPELQVQQLMEKWRVRSDLQVNAGFLNELAASSGAKRLAIARLRLFLDRIFLSARIISLETGQLLWVDIIELPRREISYDLDDPIGWRLFLRRISFELISRPRPAVPAEVLSPLIALPAVPVDMGTGMASVYSDCLFKALLESGRWWVPDPALALTRLQSAGIDPALLPREAIAPLSADLAGAPLLAAQIVCFDRPRSGSGFAFAEEGRASEEQDFRSPHYCALRLIDSASGFLSFATDRYREAEPLRGLFGVPRPSLWLPRFQRLAQELVQELPASNEVP